MNNDKLFTEIEHTDDVQARAAQFEALRQPVEEVTRSQNKPVPTLKFECRSCSIFEQCTGKDVDNHIFDIPRLSQRKFNELNELGVDCIEEIPEDFELTENQSHVRRCVQTGKAHVADDLKSMLATAKFPIYYLDFETLMTALPLYPDVAPYTQLPTQYSIHKCSVPGKIENHYEFLSDPSHDSRKALATNLIEALGKEGSIIVYSSFEKTILNNLAIQYPELAKDLSAIATRLIDLNAIILKSFYHPDFHGSTSIKVTLPVLAPELSYDDLEIKDGGTAVVTFAYLALGRFNAKDAELAKKNLLRYCERDTLAMVELHNQLMAFT